jgi:hypothetical protein
VDGQPTGDPEVVVVEGLDLRGLKHNLRKLCGIEELGRAQMVITIAPGFRGERRTNRLDPKYARLRCLDWIFFCELEAVGFSLAARLQWALCGINVLVPRQTANRTSRVRGGIDPELVLLPRQASRRLPSVVRHGSRWFSPVSPRVTQPTMRDRPCATTALCD